MEQQNTRFFDCQEAVQNAEQSKFGNGHSGGKRIPTDYTVGRLVTRTGKYVAAVAAEGSLSELGEGVKTCAQWDSVDCNDKVNRKICQQICKNQLVVL